MIGDLFIFLAVCYFLPAFIAMCRGHRNAVAIFALNVFAGWTFVGWLIALVWAFSASQAPRAP